MYKISIFQPVQKDEVIELISQIQCDEFNVEITPDQQPDLQDIPGFYQKGKGNFWVCTADGNVVGTISLLDIGLDEAALRKMFVHTEHRGKEKGVAQQLLHALLDWAKNKRLKTVYLGTTPVFKAAHRFYEKNGFQEIAKDQLPPTFPIMEVDKKFYKYTFE